MKKKEELAHYIAAFAQRAILYEVSTTPKPGLVDRDNSGSHRDMDFFTFMASSSALYSGLYECAIQGLTFEQERSSGLLDILRNPGIQCENAMFEATGGVNTHKGIIFSMGILCAAAGRIYRRQGIVPVKIEEACKEVSDIAMGLTSKDFRGVHEKQTLTHGERLYLEYGFKGIRGEVEGGFITVRENAVGIMRDWERSRHLTMNDLFLEILISLMAGSEDTNVIIRGGIESLKYVKEVSREFLQAGGMTHAEAKQKLEDMNREFVNRNISPGGSADLLAVSIFLGMLEGIIK